MNGLETIIRALDKATVPIRLPDRAVKVAFDALAEREQKKGRDRYTLATITGLGAGAAFGGIGVALPFYGYWASGIFMTVIGGTLGLAMTYLASEKRNYSVNKGKEKIMDLVEECDLKAARIGRLPLLLLGVETATLIPNEHFAVLPALGLLALGAYGYLIDGDTSGYDKTKAAVGSLYKRVNALFPGKDKLPAPVPT